MSSPSMRPRRRDPAFLRMAIIAATGGVLAIVFSIGFPLWARFSGHPYNPMFSLFAAWGILALCGAYGCLHTYFLSDKVGPRPPHGGLPLPQPRPLGILAAARRPETHERDRAA